MEGRGKGREGKGRESKDKETYAMRNGASGNEDERGGLSLSLLVLVLGWVVCACVCHLPSASKH